MFNIPDHPVIRSIERTGYPYWIHDDGFIAYCARCGSPIYEGDHYAMSYALDHEVCENCMLGDDDPMWEED